MSFQYDALVLFLALFALYSPVAALSSYLPIIRPYTHAEQLRLALGLVVNVTVFVLLAIWVGEPLLELLGISTAALTATGGIALILASVPLMTGKATPPAPESAAPVESTPAAAPAPSSSAPADSLPAASSSSAPAGSLPVTAPAPSSSASAGSLPATAGPPAAAVPASASSAAAAAVPASASPAAATPLPAAATPLPATPAAPGPTHKSGKSVLFTPITFPLTVGGTTFAFGVGASADVGSATGRLLLSVAALAYAIVTGLTLYAAGHVERRISPAAAAILDRIAGILLTAIAVVLLTNGFTELALSAIDRFQ
ncbi:hypothetical protein Ade02nite_28530 [Paractinoplanes deccanensis]|uniref:UPF0056 membrane protein n=1 Tax=Paractinoplanes deccanensis TaxID=113561 RepID=A0ABQ3Y2N1_9ACTN|nr:MarC family protein [Actinoplanes deccanensis]GID74212.1 hypothetical protein Ade02nite_28530 [Actinoplanes deccanensis]